MATSLQYRPDIDGLRAIAVLSVVFYHFGAGWLPGGFTGVDVFFVISGYIITLNIMEKVQAGEFSIRDFYIRRIKRIVPALVFMIATVLIVGWIFIVPPDYRLIGKSAIYSVLGLGNLYFYGNTDYFDPKAETQPLLHTWSLGVEEQFYLVWPIAFLIATIFFKTRLRIAVALAAFTFSAFIFSEWATQSYSKAAFYLPFARAWELALGCLIAFLPPIRSRLYSEFTVLIGLLLVGISIFTVNVTQSFPGFGAVYACFGAAAIVAPKRRDGIFNAFLTFEPIRLVGLISYSLYLWHWPIIVYYREIMIDHKPGVLVVFTLLLLSVSVSYVSYALIEQPFRKARKSFVWLPISAATVVLTFGVGVLVTKGAPFRIPPSVMTYADGALDFSRRRPVCHRTDEFRLPLAESCRFGAQDSLPRYAIWSDSHGVELGEALGNRLGESGRSIVALTYTSCPPALNFNAPYQKGCDAFTSSALAYLLNDDQIHTIYLAGYWEYYINSPYRDALAAGMQASLSSLVQAGKKVVLVASNPEITGTRIPQAAVQYAMLGKLEMLAVTIENHNKSTAISRELLMNLSTQYTNVTLYDPVDALCLEHVCPMVLNNEPVLFDDNHLTLSAAAIVAKDMPLF
jgi:peptidoglycan/LPS O-acetylase OafA/YrhL